MVTSPDTRPEPVHASVGDTPAEPPRVKDPVFRAVSEASPYTSSEVTRLMSIGAYLDREFCGYAVTLLMHSRSRAVAPSLGFDAVTVLAHCLRARDLERDAAWRILLAWVVAVGLVILLGSLAVGIVVSTVAGGETSGAAAVLLLAVVVLAVVLLGPHFTANSTARRALMGVRALILPGDSARAYRERVLRILLRELGEERFNGQMPKVADRYRDLLETIGREQHSPVVVYDDAEPFRGAGEPLQRWQMTVDLHPAEDGGGEHERPPHELTARHVLDLVRPQLESLTESAAAGSRDRLARLEIAECVFLPGPLPYGQGRSSLPTGPSTDPEVERHLAEAVGEGGEVRRHFLRIRIGGWEERVVTTVFVRLHTQGRMLFVEVAPHVLSPLHPSFEIMGALVQSAGLGKNAWREVARYVRMPLRPTELLNTLRRFDDDALEPYSELLALPPATSLREYVSCGRLSPFQRMDVVRYVKTVHVRISEGIRQALRDAGYQTDEFAAQAQQQTVNIAQGGVFVGGDMSGGAVATGREAQAQSGGTAEEGRSRSGRED